MLGRRDLLYLSQNEELTKLSYGSDLSRKYLYLSQNEELTKNETMYLIEQKNLIEQCAN